MSKPVTFEAFVDLFGGAEKLKASGGTTASFVFAVLNVKNFSTDISQRKALLRELQKQGLLKPGECFMLSQLIV